MCSSDLMKKMMADLEDAPLLKAQLDQATAEKPQLAEKIKRLKHNLAGKSDELNVTTKRCQKLEIEVKENKPQNSKLAELKANNKIYQQQWEDIIAAQARGKREFEIIKQKEKELEKVNKQLINLKEESRLYDLLHNALGKDGIQALIIENMLPELEITANDILRRLTDGRTQLAFVSQRDLKSGESRETLEIVISDELGPRSYEMFSGGEAFRINFAIRIAISKLLANRAGASLKLLIIDEGFGTQDEEGLAYLIQAIKHISDDFEKLIVVTHLPNLQQAFPVSIQVHKDPKYGSRFQIVRI